MPPAVKWGRSRLVAAVSGVATGLLLALWGAPATYGHAALLGSDPPPGVRLSSAPSQLMLSFSEPLNRTLARAHITRVGGATVAAPMATSSRTLVLRPVQTLGRGAYRVRWHSVSTADGHTLQGSFSFGVRVAPAGGAGSLQQSPFARGGWLRVGVRVLLYAGLLLFTGRWYWPCCLRDAANRG